MNDLILRFVIFGMFISLRMTAQEHTLPRVFPGQRDDLLSFNLKKAAGIFNASLKLPSSKSEWEKHKQALKLKIIEKTGVYTNHNLPAKMQETGHVQMDGFNIKNIMFQTRPDVYATASLYVPEGKGPFPAVVVTHGHWPDARRSELFQSVAQVLAGSGYVALVIDAWGTGERCTEDGKQEYHGANLGASLMNSGESLLGMQLTDNIRAVDLLSSLSYVDKSNIGATGASGGGNQTMWLAAIDERIKAVIPVVSVGTFQSYILNSNCVCELLPQGLTFTEENAVLGLIAPRALKIFSAKNDTNKSFFPAEMLKSYAGAKEIFEFYNAENKIAYQIFDTGHGYWPEMRAAMLGWFDLQLKGKGDGASVKSPDVKPLPAAALATYTEGRRPKEIITTADFCRLKNAHLHKKMLSDKSYNTKEKVEGLKKILSLNQQLKLKSVHKYGEENGWLKFVIETTSGNVIPFLLKEPLKKSKKYTLITHSGGKDSIPKADINDVLKKGEGLLLIDLWGTGEQASAEAIKVDGTLPSFHTLARSAQWMGNTVIGNWIQDIQLVDAWLKKRDEKISIRIQGYKETAIASLFYAAIFNKTNSIVLYDAPYSYRFDQRQGIDFYNMAIHIPDILKWGDISLATSLSDAEIVFVNARSMAGNIPDPKQKEMIAEEFEAMRKNALKKGPVKFIESKTN